MACRSLPCRASMLEIIIVTLTVLSSVVMIASKTGLTTIVRRSRVASSLSTDTCFPMPIRLCMVFLSTV